MNFYKFCLLLETEKKNYLSKSFGFKEWFFLVEGFKSKEQLQQLVSKFVKLSPEYNEETVSYYLQVLKELIEIKTPRIRDNIEGVTIDINKRYDITSYQTFEEIKNTVDYVRRYVDITKLQFSDFDREKFYSILSIDHTELESDSSKMIYSDNKIQIFYAATKQACIKQKDRPEYSWCISASTEGQNLYNAYRYKDHQPTFYFVKNIEKTNNEFKIFSTVTRTLGVATSGKVNFKDKYHFFVIQVIKGVDKKDPSKEQYIVTSAENDGDKMMSWEQIVQIEPLLNGKQELFEHYPLTEYEMKFYQKYRRGISDEEFAELDVKDKEMYLDVFVDFYKKLSDYQFASLNDDLKNKYINFGVGLTNGQYDLIKENKLNKRYEKVTIEKIKILFKENHQITLTDSEWEIFYKNANQFDLSELDFEKVYKLLVKSKKPLEMAEILGSEKIKKLTSEQVYGLLIDSPKPLEMAQALGTENIKKLTPDQVYFLLIDSPNPIELAKTLGSEHINKLDSGKVYYLIIDSPNPVEMAQALGTDKIKKLNSKLIYQLLKYSSKPLELAKFFEPEKVEEIFKNLDSKDVYDLLYHSSKPLEMAQVLGSENINKLNSYQIYELLGNSPNPIEMAKALGSSIIKKLNSYQVYGLLIDSPKPLEMAQALGTENIKKIDQSQIDDLLRYSRNPEEIEELFNNIHNI